MDTFFKLFSPHVLNAFAAVGLVFLHFTFYKLFQENDPERSSFFFYLGLGWIVNLFYLMFLDLQPSISINPSITKVIIRDSNTLTFFFFLLAARWQTSLERRSRLTIATVALTSLAIASTTLSLALPSFTPLLLAPGIALAPLAVTAVGINYQRHFRLSRDSFPTSTKVLLVLSVYLYALLQCLLFALPPYASRFDAAIPHFLDYLFLFGAALKILHIIALALYSQSVLADYHSQRQLIDRARICIDLSDQLAHEIETPASDLRIRLDNASQSAGMLAGAELTSAKQLVTDISNLIEIYEGFLADQRIDEQQASHNVGLCNLNSVCNSVVFSIKATLHPRCRFAQVYDQGPTIRAIQTELLQIVRNLVKNAVEAIARRGRPIHGSHHTITLQTRTLPSDRKVHLVVKDDGPGIDEAIFSRIFDKGVTTNKGRGRGNGLYITKNLVQKNGGTITARNLESNGQPQGAEFHVVLPLAIA